MAWAYTVDEMARMAGASIPHSEKVVTGVSTDTRSLKPGDLFVALQGDRFDGNTFVAEAFIKGASACLATAPHHGGPVMVCSDPHQGLQRIAGLHRRAFSMPLFAVTGSCGKTSTKDFAAALLSTRFKVVKTQGNLNNEIGCPLSLMQLNADTGFAIIEMGANHMGEIAQLCRIARPTESAITMVGPAHLEGFGSIERIAAAKSEIASGLGKDGVFYINTDDDWCNRIGAQYSGQKVYIGSQGEVRIDDISYDDQGEMLLDIAPIGRLRLPLPIEAQAQNVLLAVAVALRHGVTEFEAPLRAACEASIRFRILQVGPFEVLDDAYNANPASMRAALSSLAARPGAGPCFATLGSMLELGDEADALHQEMGELAGELGYRALFARGPHAHAMIAGARGAGVPVAEAIEDHAAMARALHETAPNGGRLLVKGSRGMRMESVLAALESQLDVAVDARHPAPIEDAE